MKPQESEINYNNLQKHSCNSKFPIKCFLGIILLFRCLNGRLQRERKVGILSLEILPHVQGRIQTQSKTNIPHSTLSVNQMNIKKT